MDIPSAPFTLHSEHETGMLHHQDTLSLEESHELIPKTPPPNIHGDSIPTAPPSPLPVHKPGELRRHDTIFFLPEYLEMDVPPTLRPEHETGMLHRHDTLSLEKPPEIPNTPSPDFLGDSIPTAPPSPLPVYKPGQLRRHDTLFFLPVHPEMDVPTVPPSPHPEYESRMLRRQDAFFLEQSPEIPKTLPPDFLRLPQDNDPQQNSDTSLGRTNEDMFEGDSIPSAPSSSSLTGHNPGETLSQDDSLFFLHQEKYSHL
ncbi:hypothetical protein F5878DRAFT_664163 [Lentinula raphanica]|uniref:Uncharacterized protein n=1 Tax=Lentinula raphanica TaxID=153919 RepID=A0AA38UA27_9AGAR|nr:hypothetical protein F5878DRAFT_664163 [Lentinula raphanica]